MIYFFGFSLLYYYDKKVSNVRNSSIILMRTASAFEDI